MSKQSSAATTAIPAAVCDALIEKLHSQTNSSMDAVVTMLEPLQDHRDAHWNARLTKMVSPFTFTGNPFSAAYRCVLMSRPLTICFFGCISLSCWRPAGLSLSTLSVTPTTQLRCSSACPFEQQSGSHGLCGGFPPHKLPRCRCRTAPAPSA